MDTRRLMKGMHAYLPGAKGLAALDDGDAMARGQGPHSIAEILAHMVFWQDWFLDWCDGTPVAGVASAAQGWPAVRAEDWPGLVSRFRAGLERGGAMGDDAARLARPLAEGVDLGPITGYTVADALMHVAIHNAHHMGQIVSLRQAMGLWPPPEGGWTW